MDATAVIKAVDKGTRNLNVCVLGFDFLQLIHDTRLCKLGMDLRALAAMAKNDAARKRPRPASLLQVGV